MKTFRTILLLGNLLAFSMLAASEETARIAPTVSLTALVAPEGTPANLGQVQAFIVRGNIQLVDSNGNTTALKRGQIFTEGNTIKTGADSQVLLVFSNGAALKVVANSEVKVTLFRQEPFNIEDEGAFLRLARDPSRSNVILDVHNGKLGGTVKELNKDAGSTFLVNGPAEINGVL